MDINKKRERYQRFWAPLTKGEGAYLGVVSPVDDSGAPPYILERPSSLEERWLSADYSVRRAEASERNLFWGLDAVHSEFVNFGPGVHAAILGAPYTLQMDSVWFDLEPPIHGWDPAPRFVTDRNHPLYLAIEAQTRALCAASKGRYAVSYTDLGGVMDVLFSLRGEELLADLIEYPELVINAQQQLDREFLTYYNELTGIIGPSGCGYTGWIPVLSDQPWYPVQCDLSVMISPAMFERFVMPSLDMITSTIGRGMYHLDGPEQIKHLDMLLSLEHVHAIQWVPLPIARGGANRRAIQDFADDMSLNVYRRTLAAGKKVVLLMVNPDQVSRIFDAVGTDGVFIISVCPKRAQADEMIAHALKHWVK